MAKKTIHFFNLATLKKITTFEPKKNSTCGFDLRIEEGQIYSEINKSGPWVTRKLVDLDLPFGKLKKCIFFGPPCTFYAHITVLLNIFIYYVYGKIPIKWLYTLTNIIYFFVVREFILNSKIKWPKLENKIFWRVRVSFPH